MGSMPSGKSRCGAHLDAWIPLLWILGPEGIISPLSEAVEREWEQKRPVLHFGNAHGAREAEPWVGPATYWLLPDLVEELGSPNL